MFASNVRIAPHRPNRAGLLNLGWGTTNRGSGSLVGAPAPRLNIHQAIGARDAELARLDQRRSANLERHRAAVATIFAGVRTAI